MTRLQSFLYLLMRDELTPGKVERIMQEVSEISPDESVKYSNKHLADYAAELASRLGLTLREWKDGRR